MSMKNLPPEIQEKLKKIQNVQNQLQVIASQIDLSQSKASEHKSTIKELDGVGDDVKLYKTVGQIMFASNASTVRKELGDELELLELKISTLKKQEEKGKVQLDELNSFLNQYVSTQNKQANISNPIN